MELDRLFSEELSHKAIALYMYCCHKANWEDGKWMAAQGETEVKRGDFITSQYHLAEAINLSREEVRKALAQLVEAQFITQVTHRMYTTIHIVRYCGNESLTYFERQSEPSHNQVGTTVVDVKTLRRKETAFASLEKPAEPATTKPAVKEVVPLPPPSPDFDRPFPLGDADADPDPLDLLTKKGKIKIYNGPK